MQPGKSKCEQQERAQHLRCIAEREDPAAIEAIGGVPGNETQGYERQKLATGRRARDRAGRA